MQPMTLMIKVAGVNTEKAVYPGWFEHSYHVPAGDLQKLAKERIPFPAGHVLIYRSTLPGIVTLNMTNCIDVDGTNAEDLTRAEKVCRGQIEPVLNFLKTCVPGFENCFVISTASIIGVRETRHFIGEYTITEEDLAKATLFEDWIVTRAQMSFDIHNVKGPGLDENGSFSVPYYTIPYRCFIPKAIDNLLLAGRNISGTHKAHASYRVMPICVNMGQGVGVAAALCAKEDITPKNLEAKRIQQVLIEQGVKV